MMKKIKIAILGASGYTGAELIRLLANHPYAQISALSADRKAGQSIGDIYPHLSMLNLPVLQKIDDIRLKDIELVFCALPHGLTQSVIKNLPSHLRVIDLSADFRFEDTDLYKDWYKKPHEAIALQKKFTYGLSEIYKEQIKNSQYIACTGCYVACAILPLIPLVQANLISLDDIIIDAKSGISGGGRSPKENLLFAECSEGSSAYGVKEHRHSGEINKELSKYSDRKITVDFTPHLLPQNRGILSTIYVNLAENVIAQQIHNKLIKFYNDESFVNICDFGNVPQTQFVRGSNYAMIGVSEAANKNKVKIISVLDNLIKGASGQAVQNMNICYDFPEDTALQQLPLFP